MVDLSQTLLVIVITALTILLTFIGVQIIYILREIRRSIEKVNKMLDDAGMITESIAHPIAGLGGMIDGLKSGVKAIEVIGNFLTKKKKEEITSETEEN
jgi:hypothetical protein